MVEVAKLVMAKGKDDATLRNGAAQAQGSLATSTGVGGIVNATTRMRVAPGVVEECCESEYAASCR